jgi:hypothetical protein
MKIVGFAQMRNELQRGNLKNWLTCMDVCDWIYVYDQGSTDGSHSHYHSLRKVNGIFDVQNRFFEEGSCKNQLLRMLLQQHPDTDWIFWMDGDTILDGRLWRNGGEGLRELCSRADTDGFDGISFGHYNLWRSDLYYRVDNSYHALHGHVVALWKVRKGMHFQVQPGLHGKTTPSSVQRVRPFEFSLIHRGFATDDQILSKYDTYKEHGQDGWALSRIVDESSLTVERIPLNVLPQWYPFKDPGVPFHKEKLVNIQATRWKA